MDHLYTSVQAYAAAYSAAEPPLLAKINQETHAEVAGARMLSGHLQGRALAMFSQMIRPSRILELGTYTGYATLCLAEGLQEKGILYTIDRDKSLEKRVRGYFEQAGIASRIRYCLGEALDIIPQLDEVFDLVFIDADKKNYSLYYELLLEKVRLGGFIIADNVLWNGKVLPEGVPMDKQTKTMSDFNKQVNEDTRVEPVLFPIRDGLMILRKRC
jgi:predicted O-methyltransferase YrrM